LKKNLVLMVIIFLIGCAPGDDSTARQNGRLLETVPSLSELAGTPAAEIPPLPTLVPAEIALGQQIYRFSP
jgi:hypothetical protein